MTNDASIVFIDNKDNIRCNNNDSNCNDYCTKDNYCDGCVVINDGSTDYCIYEWKCLHLSLI